MSFRLPHPVNAIAKRRIGIFMKYPFWLTTVWRTILKPKAQRTTMAAKRNSELIDQQTGRFSVLELITLRLAGPYFVAKRYQLPVRPTKFERRYLTWALKPFE